MGKNKYYCKIDGKIYNLKKIQDIIDENPEHPDIAKIYIAAVEEYHLPTNTMLDSVITFNNNEIPADYNEALKKMQNQNQASLSRCPRCGSTNIKYNLEFASWMAAQGQEPVSDSVLKDNKCGNCGFKW